LRSNPSTSQEPPPPAPPPPSPQITSDSDSCADIALSHHYEPTLDLAARDCLLSGTDIDSGGTYSGHLAKAVAAGLNTSYVESALRNSYKVHGMPLASKPAASLGHPAHPAPCKVCFDTSH
jgi:hypothetical protein